MPCLPLVLSGASRAPAHRLHPLKMPHFLQACLPADLLAKLGDLLDALIEAMASSAGVVILASDGSLSPVPSPSPPRSSPTPGGSPAPAGSSPSPGGSPAPGGSSPSPGVSPAPGGSSPSPGVSPAPGGSSPSPGVSPSPGGSSPSPGVSPAPGGSSPSPGVSPVPGGGSPSPGTYGGQSPRGPTPGADPSPPEQIRCDFMCTVPAADPGNDMPQNCTRTGTGAKITLRFQLCSDGNFAVPCHRWIEFEAGDDPEADDARVQADGNVACQPTSGTNVCCLDVPPPPLPPPPPPQNCDLFCSSTPDSGQADPIQPVSCHWRNDIFHARPVDSRCVLPDSEDGYCHKHFMWVDDSAVERGMMACDRISLDHDDGFCCLDIALDCQLGIPWACTVRSHGWLMMV
jgi:hypothetical protein